MEDKKIKQIWWVAYFYAHSWGYASEAEDFAQEYVLETIRNPKRAMKYVWIDYLRKKFGSPNIKNGHEAWIKYQVNKRTGGIDHETLDFEIRDFDYSCRYFWELYFDAKEADKNGTSEAVKP